MSARPPTPIGPAQAALMAGPVSIIVGSRDAALRPHLMRAVGCRLDEDRRRVTVLMSAAGSGEVLADLRANGMVAVVFSEPSSHRTLQVKGRDATVGPCGADDAAHAERHLRGFVDEIGHIGFAAVVAHTLLAHQGDLVAVRFTVDEAFEQTPGPSAGEPLPPQR
ncbi:pyridoxamine 5'-phosphate oxidase family protein [Azohydromonas sediminis]|uniref:pyridoxamine 5'-phosphate oxidase family protein n=1 Tax=Azohydromonas sediminis TaxID=2259674 RepID=UPI000E64C94F|nr:pyridoxamine 5'-phosphate oxidase family protein [Azohydromonas sediminis]